MSYFAPTDLKDAFATLAGAAGAGRDTAVVAGGTDFFPALGEGARPRRVLDVTRLAGFRGISRAANAWRFGAATCWDDIARADLPAAFDGLRLAAREVGAIQIQKSGTIGGNLCNASPAADGLPPLLCLKAAVELVSARGTRVLPLADFVLGVRKTALRTDELLRAVIVPDAPEQALSGFAKLGARKYMVISIAMVSALIVPDGAGRVDIARISVGACSPVACRLPAAEAALHGVPLAEMAARLRPEHFAGLTPIDDVRASGAYRFEAAYHLTGKLLAGLTQESANG